MNDAKGFLFGVILGLFSSWWIIAIGIAQVYDAQKKMKKVCSSSDYQKFVTEEAHNQELKSEYYRLKDQNIKLVNQISLLTKRKTEIIQYEKTIRSIYKNGTGICDLLCMISDSNGEKLKKRFVQVLIRSKTIDNRSIDFRKYSKE